MAASSDASLLRVITCGYDAGTWFVALGYCITSRCGRAWRQGLWHPASSSKRRPPPLLTPRRSRAPCSRHTRTRSLLSIINKFAVLHFPFPAALTGFQYAVSAAAVIFLCVPPAPGLLCCRSQPSLTGYPAPLSLSPLFSLPHGTGPRLGGWSL